MKKLILTCSVLAIAVGAMAQGAVGGFGLGSGVYVSAGAGNTQEFDSGLLSAGFTMQILFSSTATAANVAAINALNGSVLGGFANEQSTLTAEGFTTAAATVTGLASHGSASTMSGFPGSVQLNSAFAGSTVGYYALVFTATSGAYAGDTAVIASGNGTSAGGNYGAATPGTPYNIGSGSTYASYLGSPGFNDIDLTVAPTPEPTTMALAGLGGLSLLALRRKK